MRLCSADKSPMAFSRYDEFSGYDPYPYDDFHDSSQNQPSMAYSGDETSIYRLLENNNPPACYSATAYSASTYSQPMLIEYDPNFFNATYNPGLTQFVISYSVSEFNEPEFDDYDPTPYDGGYDLVHTYGKPLPPTDEICYPRSNSGEKVADGSIVIVEPQAAEIPVEKTILIPDREEEDKDQEFHGSRGDEDEKYDEPIGQIPSGYGLEAMDICESLFGYWPCLAKMNRGRNSGEDGNGGRNGNQWKSAADYLFGSSYPYEEIGNGYGYESSSNGEDVYCYQSQRHYQDQPIYGEIEYVENSWLHKLNTN